MDFLRKITDSFKTNTKKTLIVFATCCVMILILGANGFKPNSEETVNAQRSELLIKEDEEPAKAQENDKIVSDYYTGKIAAAMENVKEEEHVLELADSLEDRQFVTSGKLFSRPSRTLSGEEYEIFTRIVEAEVGAETYDLKLLVANIILNRVENRHFPSSIKEVVFQNNGRNYQFSPISNGSYYRVNVQDSTIKAVNEALAGRDNSVGALYFMTRSISTAGNVTWFDTHLTKVGQIGKVEYFK